MNTIRFVSAVETSTKTLKNQRLTGGSKLLTACLIGLSSVVPLTVNGQVYANFSGGNSTTSVDAFTGTAGEGWLGGWNESTYSNGNFNNTTVTDTDPLGDGQNRLAIVLQSTSGLSGGALRRQFDNNYGILNSSPTQVVSFDFRLDAALNSTNTTFIDMYEQTGANSGVRGTVRWLIRVVGANRGGAEANTFAFFDGDGTGASGQTMVNDDWANFVSSGMEAVVGTVYSITVTSNAQTQTYSVMIDDGNTIVSSGELGWWTSAETNGNQLYFGGATTEGALEFSVDNISIVPEPAHVTLLIGALSFLGLLFYRSKKA